MNSGAALVVTRALAGIGAAMRFVYLSHLHTSPLVSSPPGF
jgi:hypothetical protein